MTTSTGKQIMTHAFFLVAAMASMATMLNAPRAAAQEAIDLEQLLTAMLDRSMIAEFPQPVPVRRLLAPATEGSFAKRIDGRKNW